ncbi:MAG: small multi-drug export protein [Candidatus Gracilibacteria bacterium]|jgi:uncharacterized membrane protein
MSPELKILIISLIPFLDKIAVPYGIELNLSAPTIFLFSLTGNVILTAGILYLLGPISNFLRKKSTKMDDFFEKLFNKTRKEHTKKFDRYGALMLILFVASPLPGSGSIAGSVIAFVFGINYFKALALISLGSAGGILLMIAGFTSIFAIFDLFI